MTGFRTNDEWRLLLGVATLALATSCVPDAHPHAIAHKAVEPEASALLRGLALSVPADIADPAVRPVTSEAFAAIPTLSAAPPFIGARSPDDADRATDCLTAAVYYEARSQPADGQRAVAQVVLNRVRDRAFPNSVCGVVYQGSTRRTGCQFTFTCDGSLYRPRDDRAWGRARDIASAALSGEVYAPVGAATYYHANSVLPWWASSLTRIGAVGAHIFYRWRGAMERTLAFRQQYAGIESAPSIGNAGASVASAALGYAEEVVGTVTVHRGGAAAAAQAAGRTMFVSGVRIHFGGRVEHAVDSSSISDRAVVSDETTT